MKNRRIQSIFSFLIAFVFCCALFFGISFVILYQTKPKESAAPESAVPANRSAAFTLYIHTDEKNYLLDVKPQQSAAFLEAAKPEDEERQHYTVTATKSVLRSLCEQLGGIEYNENGQAVKLTGQHLIDRYGAEEFDILLKLLLNKIFKSRDTLSISYAVLTKNSATDISYVAFYENAEALTGITVY